MRPITLPASTPPWLVLALDTYLAVLQSGKPLSGGREVVERRYLRLCSLAGCSGGDMTPKEKT